jgi:hypothetical protein
MFFRDWSYGVDIFRPTLVLDAMWDVPGHEL